MDHSQVQKMFAFLQQSETRAYNPKGLCMALKDWDGNPINTAIQDDAAAYINKLVEGIDNEIRWIGCLPLCIAWCHFCFEVKWLIAR